MVDGVVSTYGSVEVESPGGGGFEESLGVWGQGGERRARGDGGGVGVFLAVFLVEEGGFGGGEGHGGGGETLLMLDWGQGEVVVGARARWRVCICDCEVAGGGFDGAAEVVEGVSEGAHAMGVCWDSLWACSM